MTSTLLAPQTYHGIVKKHLQTSDNECIKFSVEQISEEFSNCAERLVLTIRVKSGKEIKNLRFLVKLHPKSSSGINYVQQKTGFDKEIFAYSVYFENIKIYLACASVSELTSRHFYSKPDEVIVLQNLADEEYDIASSEILDQDHIKLTLKKIAELHSTSLAYEELKSKKIGKAYRLGDDFSEELKEGYYRIDEEQLQATHQDTIYLIDALLEKNVAKEKLKTKVSKKFEQIFETFCSSDKHRNVFSHGNLQGKNVLFKYENNKPTSCRLINFNSIRYAPPAVDVLDFLLHTTDFETRKSSLDDYLIFYYETLKQQLKKYKLCIDSILPVEEFQTTCDKFLPVVKLIHIYKALAKAIENHSVDLGTGKMRQKVLIDIIQSDKNFAGTIATEIDKLTDTVVNDVVTLEDCFKILKRKLGNSNYDLKKYELIPFEEKCGFLGEHYHLHIVVTVHGETRNIKFFVKSIANTKSQRDYIESNGTAFKEMRMFTKLMPLAREHGIDLLDENVPTVYLCKQDGTVVLNNLGNEGYIQLNKTDSLDFNTAKLSVQALAKFHASFLILEEKISELTDQNYRLIDDFQREFREVFYAECGMSAEVAEAAITGLYPTVEEFYDDNSKLTRKKFLELAMYLIRNQYKNVVPSKKFRNTICHGDAWVNNLMFKYDGDVPTNCVIIDFQSYRYCPPAIDLLFTIYLTTDRSFREKHYGEMLEIYYAEMTKHLNSFNVNVDNVLPYSDFIESCKIYKESVLGQTLTHFQIIMLGKELLDKLFSDPDYFHQTLFRNKKEFIKMAFKKDPPFRRRVCESLLDLKDYYESQLS